MSKAVLAGKNWFGYYWTPTSLIGKHKMIKVPFGVPFAGNSNWENCLVKSEQDCANPKKSAWIKSEVYTIVTDKFKKAGGGSAAEFLSKRTYPGSALNSMLVYMADNQAEGSDAAIEFLQKHEDIWTKWVPSNIASKIKSSL
jgi:glycine betaine/proline transport system substrate-binding protein